MTGLSILAALAGVVTVQNATLAPAPASPSDYSQEAIVVEQSRTLLWFDDDGTGRRDVYMRVRTQSEAGVQQYGQVVFGCNSANERIEVAFVRVRKPDGTVVATSPASVQDLTAPVQRVAPVYTDFRQKHVTVESLRPGDTLEFGLVTTVRIPRSRRGTSGASTRSRRTGETRRARLTDIGSLCTRGVPEC